MHRVVARRDCMIACGHRTDEEQNDAYERGFSKVQYPDSKHNSTPSMAVDVVPWPSKWSDMDCFQELALIIREEWAKIDGIDKQGFKLKWGGNWSYTGSTIDNDMNFIDTPHWQIER